MFDEIYIFDDTNKAMPKFPKDATEAMAYVPFQSNDKTFPTEQGFMSGTMFPILNKPFKGCGIK